MNQHQHSPEQMPSGLDTPAATSLDRRRLLKMGAGASPVLLSLASKPAMAGGMRCGHHQSGWASAGSRTVVDNGDHSTHSSGCSPSYWRGNYNSWPRSCNKTTKYSACLGATPPSGCADTLWDALGYSDELTKQFAAAYLNCVAGKYGSNTIIDQGNLSTWWQACKNNGEVTINSDGRIRKDNAYWKSSTPLSSPDSRAGGFLNLLKSINTIN